MPTETATADPQQSTSIFDEPEVEETESIAGDEPSTSAVETEESTEGAEPEVEAQSDEEDTEYLPSEQSKVFPVEELARYGKRYGYTLEEIQADPRLQSALKDKINSDILIQQQKDAESQLAEEEPALEEEQVEQPQLAPAEARAQWFKSVESFVDQTTDPEVAKQFAEELSSVTDPKTGKVDPVKITRAFSKFGVNLINTALPALIPQVLQGALRQMYPEIDSIMEYQADQMNKPMYQQQWSKVKSSNPDFQTLPDFGTADFRPWAMETAAKIPNFDNMRFVGANGQPLSKEQTAYAKYNLLAQVGLGQRVTPAIVKQAAETGKRQAAESQKKKLAGNLGAGQSKGQIAAKKTGNSDIFGDVGEVALSSRL
jgi:hypothetical protein